MKKIYTLLDESGFVLNAQYFEEGQQPINAVPELVTEHFVKAKFNFETRTFFEGATPEEIAEANKPIVPEKVTAIQFIAQLSFEGISEANIMAVIDTLNEPDRTVSKVSYNRAVYFERANPFISLIGQAFNKSETDLDDIFINASKIW